MPHAFFAPLVFIVQVFWFLAPGLAVAAWLCRKKYIDTLYAVPIAGVFSCLLAYGAFWIFLSSPQLGNIYSWTVFAFGIIALTKLIISKTLRKLLLSFEVLFSLSLWCLTAFFYTSLTFGCRITPVVMQVDQFCHTNNISFDNTLPKLFANNVYSGHSRALIGDWQGSDRPPLQTGAVLLEAPLTESSSTSVMSYELLATFLQVLWVPVIWLLARRLGLGGRQISIIFILCLVSGFFFFNSVFTWPKLLAASLGGIGLSLLLFEKPSKIRWILAGTAMGLGLLAHSGVAFAFIPLIIVLLQKRFFSGWKIALVGASAALLLFAPWMAYQHFYDPPGNRLLKWEIAGDIPIDDLGFGTALRKGYSHVGIHGAINNKIENLTTLVYADDGNNHLYGQGVLGMWRDMEFRFVFFGLGLLNLGWLGLLRPNFRQRLKKATLDWFRLKLLLEIAVATLGIWVIIMFGPGSTIIHGGSYLTMLLLFLCLTSLITVLPRFLIRAIVAIKIGYFALIWVAAVYFHHLSSMVYIIYSLLAGLGIVYCLNTLSGHKFTND